jgi:NADP-dependent 3-hydroxy acid dehydrogenase YdfG
MKSNMRITSVSPGRVETDFRLNMWNDADKAKNFYSQFVCLQSEDVASAVEFVLPCPPHMEVDEMIIRSTQER